MIDLSYYTLSDPRFSRIALVDKNSRDDDIEDLDLKQAKEKINILNDLVKLLVGKLDAANEKIAELQGIIEKQAAGLSKSGWTKFQEDLSDD